jgi:large subunit ribosomal protein L21
MYAIVKTGGKQYRVEQGQSLLVERLPASEGDSVALDPLLYVDGSKVVDQVDGLSSVTVEARVVAHERGPKLRVVKFKPKRGYKRRTGHRQDLTRIEVVGIKLSGGRARGAKATASDETPAPVAAEKAPAPVAAEKAPESAVAEKAPAAEKAKAPRAAKPKAAEATAEAAAEPKPEAAAETEAGTEVPAAADTEAATEGPAAADTEAATEPPAAAETEAAAEPKPAAKPRTRAAAKPKTPPADKPKTPRTRAPKKTSEEASDGT